jgi:hypothetical protein
LCFCGEFSVTPTKCSMNCAREATSSCDMILVAVVARVTLVAPRCASTVISVPNPVLRATSFLIIMWS